jgi:hypothetical protein
MRYEVKPLGVGEIFDQAIQIFRSRLGLFVLISLVLRFPETAVLQYLVLTTVERMPFQPTPAQMNEFWQRLGHLYLYVFAPMGLLEFLLISPITNAALAYAAARIYLGEEISVWGALRMALRRYVPVVWTSFLFWTIFYLGLACCILPGILLYFLFGLATTVAVLEPVSGFGALGRSRALMRSEGNANYITLFLLAVTLFFMQLGVNAGSGVIPQLHLQVLASALFGSISFALALVAQVVFYYSCRCRNEGFDLLRLARIVAETPTDAPVLQGQG